MWRCRRTGAGRLSWVLVVVLVGGVASTVDALPGARAPSATTGRVQILESSAISARARRCLTRVREELAAGGFEVTVAEFGSGSDDLWTVDSYGALPGPPEDGSLGTIALVGNPDEGAAELWIMDGVPGGRAAIRRLPLPAGAGPHDDEVLAVRTLEFLRASALSLARPPAARPVPPAGALSPPTVAKPASPDAVDAGPPGPGALEMGLCLLQSSPALGPAYLPLVRLRLELVSVLETRVSLAGLGTRPRVTAAEGSATVGQDLALLEVRASFRRGQRIRPAVGVGAGAFLARVEGTGNWPYEGLRAHRWAGLFDVGAGLTISLGRRLAIAAEVHGQFITPTPSIDFSGVEGARLGRPAVLASLTLVTPL